MDPAGVGSTSDECVDQVREERDLTELVGENVGYATDSITFVSAGKIVGILSNNDPNSDGAGIHWLPDLVVLFACLCV
ncbi:unnamed protein product [Echinostoma caproni]|uniref:Glutaminase n=1 Tax=Echinostoma caproni TaxID=27848 RepID=A0A183ATU2_9TREM|nr:unnamed protein product [Echinostoma caproni]